MVGTHFSSLNCNLILSTKRETPRKRLSLSFRSNSSNVFEDVFVVQQENPNDRDEMEIGFVKKMMNK